MFTGIYSPNNVKMWKYQLQNCHTKYMSTFRRTAITVVLVLNTAVYVDLPVPKVISHSLYDLPK
jgi:hypothetical protein